MSYVVKYNITKNNYGSILGSLKSAMIGNANTFRGDKITPDILKEVARECLEFGFCDEDEVESMTGVKLSKMTDFNLNEVNTADLVQGNDFVLAATSDAALAALYLYKLNDCVRRNISFELTLTELRQIVSKKTCYFTGRRFVNDGSSPDKLSLDRLDNSIGYTKENTVPCCVWVNRLKNELFENPRSSMRVSVKDMSKILDKMILIESKKPKPKKPKKGVEE